MAHHAVPLAHIAVPAMAETVLLACHRAGTAADFGRELVAHAAQVAEAGCCIWADWSAGNLSPLFFTPGAEKFLDVALGLAARVVDSGPIRLDGLIAQAGIDSFAAAPVRFRSQVAGVLAICNRDGGFTDEHLESLAVLGRIGLARYEHMRLAEDFRLRQAGEERACRLVADLAHDLSQPLSVIAAAVFCMDMIVSSRNHQVRQYLEKVEEQVEVAGHLLQNVSRSLQISALGSALSDSEAREVTKPASSGLA
jgi:hypothetical protein